MSGTNLIVAERRRQIKGEKYGACHDDCHEDELVRAAACYALEGTAARCVEVSGKKRPVIYQTELSPRYCMVNEFKDAWPWGHFYDKRWKHKRLKRMVIAGALIAAEIDRLLRAGHKF